MSLITWADKSAIGTQPTIPLVNKITDSDMNEIKTAINNSTNYSDTEIVVGTYLDKPLYRKVINFGVLPNASQKFVSHNITNIGIMKNLTGVAFRSSDSTYYPLPYSSPTLANNIQLNANATSIYITTGINRSNLGTCYVIVEYTKSTD